MDKLRLLPLELPSATNINSNGTVKGKISFVRRLAVGFIILATLGLLYVPAYHSAQGSFLGLGETPSPAKHIGVSHLVASVAQLPGWAYNTSRDLCVYIHPENTTSVLSPNDICSPSPYLFIVICSAITNVKARIAMRNTWANKNNLNNTYNSTVKSMIAEESHQYNDIIQEKFYDTYNNLTLKSVMMLKWVTSNCGQAKYLMKTDDDMFVNIPTLMRTLQSRSQTTNTLLGSLICNAKPILDPNNKWYTPKYMYSERIYPNYLSGTGYVMSLDVAFKLYHAALRTPLLHLEDVYITGLCAKHAKVRPINHSGFSYVPRKLDPCTLRNAITAHKVNVSSMYVIWKKLNDTNLSCSTHSHIAKKSVTLNRNGRNIGYYIVKRRTNKCV
ncbi:beta-1,3-galactosyltransferase 1-like isoform X2 [Frieseomelitta varia]|uniref:beta-1,3-galactosyltransferase 1-like isoform X2 n=1 Tax=Frieseomelitta varia TaxID=561572 RepID=UPI001CB6A23A|nr:beta-1,3-galactosyltransferase 1-like isoform X2 [Frieseomelitta varia]